jgi:hypothetical protein
MIQHVKCIAITRWWEGERARSRASEREQPASRRGKGEAKGEKPREKPRERTQGRSNGREAKGETKGEATGETKVVEAPACLHPPAGSGPCGWWRGRRWWGRAPSSHPSPPTPPGGRRPRRAPLSTPPASGTECGRGPGRTAGCWRPRPPPDPVRGSPPSRSCSARRAGRWRRSRSCSSRRSPPPGAGMGRHAGAGTSRSASRLAGACVSGVIARGGRGTG